jgi:hypothetical protein
MFKEAVADLGPLFPYSFVAGFAARLELFTYKYPDKLVAASRYRC